MGHPDDNWSDLMRAANAGDMRAYDRLLRDLSDKLRARIRRILIRSGRKELDVEDVVQEVLLAVHLKRDTWQPDKPFGPWVSAIAHYKTVDAMRRRGWHHHVPIEEFSDVLASEEPAMQVTDREVKRVLDRLPSTQRQVLEAVAVSGASISEAAQRMKMTEGAVRVALHRGLASLAKAHRD